MRLLLLSGPRFLGYHLIEAALQAGHDVTLFNRGRTGAHLFPDVARLVGDRADDIDALGTGEWDAVIDTSGQVPRHVADTAKLLSGRVGACVFVSSISALRDMETQGQDETAPVHELEDPANEEVTVERYGGMKAACEVAARKSFDGPVAVVRPGLIVGPRDHTDRFTYWPVRMARGGEVLAPEGPDVPTQLVDVRDLARWLLDVAERRLEGTFHATGPADPLTLGGLLEACRAIAGPGTRLQWVPADFLAAHEVAPWMDLPLWVPAAARGIVTVDASRARDEGLAFRSLDETVRDTLDWHRSERGDEPLRAGIDAARECEILAAWRREAK